MRPYLSTILSSLVGGYWLTCRSVRQSNRLKFYYSFRHPLVRSILYEQIPETFRSSAHLLIAEYLERECNKRGSRSMDNTQQRSQDNHNVLAPILSPASGNSVSSASVLVDGMVAKRRGDKDGMDNLVDTPIRYQHTLLCTAYHYRYSPPPPPHMLLTDQLCPC